MIYENSLLSRFQTAGCGLLMGMELEEGVFQVPQRCNVFPARG
jgi:hypothetical protein